MEEDEMKAFKRFHIKLQACRFVKDHLVKASCHLCLVTVANYLLNPELQTFLCPISFCSGTVPGKSILKQVDRTPKKLQRKEAVSSTLMRYATAQPSGYTMPHLFHSPTPVSMSNNTDSNHRIILRLKRSSFDIKT